MATHSPPPDSAVSERRRRQRSQQLRADLARLHWLLSQSSALMERIALDCADFPAVEPDPLTLATPPGLFDADAIDHVASSTEGWGWVVERMVADLDEFAGRGA